MLVKYEREYLNICIHYNNLLNIYLLLLNYAVTILVHNVIKI